MTTLFWRLRDREVEAGPFVALEAALEGFEVGDQIVGIEGFDMTPPKYRPVG